MRDMSACQVSSVESRKGSDSTAVEHDEAVLPAATAAAPLGRSGPYLEYARPVLEEPRGGGL